MPTRFDYTQGLHRVSCSGCEEVAYVAQLSEPESHATDFFRWHRTSARYVSRCRSCERRARAERATSGPRASRSVRAMRAVVNQDRRFGVELECVAPAGASVESTTSLLRSNGYSDWRCVYDGSLSGRGVEAVSPVLRGEAGLEQLTRVCALLKDNGYTVNRSCGTHVHHEIRDLDLPAIKRFARSWANNQHLIDGLVSDSRRGSRDPSYCGTFRASDADRVESLENIAHFRGDRYKTLNFASYARYGTVEVRQHQGTLNAAKLTQWIRFAQAMIATSAESPQPQPRHETVYNFLRDMTTRLDSEVRTWLLGRAVEFAYAPVGSPTQGQEVAA